VDNIREVLLRHKWSLAKIYTYILVAETLFLAGPTFLGKGIDGLLAGDFTYVLLLLGLYLSGDALTYKRMVLDTKVFMQIYNEIIFDYLRRKSDSPATKKIARTEMANSIVDLFENDVIYFVTALFSTVGSLAFIFAGSFSAGVLVSIGCIPMVLFTKLYFKKIAQVNRVMYDHYEGKAAAVSSGDHNLVENFFKRRKRILVMFSTINGRQWTSITLSKSIFLVSAVVVFTQTDPDLTQGETLTLFSYTSQFLSSLFAIPFGGSVFVRVKETLNRIREED
jgi:hypothetical protein